MVVKVYNKSNNPLPSYKTSGSAGLDVCANEDCIIMPKTAKLVSTGIYLGIPDGVECQVRSRSGLALKNKLFVLNSPGTIDSDYTGEVGVILYNLSDEIISVKKGQRIAQLVFAKYERVEFEVSDNKIEKSKDNERGEKGFGSTGID